MTCSEVPSWGWRLGEGCAGHPLASCEPLRTCGSRWPPTTRRAKPAAASCAHSGRSHFYAASCDRLFRFCRLRQFAPTFRLKLPFCASFSSSFSLALLALPLPLFFSLFLLYNHHNSNRRAPPKTPHGMRKLGPADPRVRGAAGKVASGRLRAGEQRRVPHGWEASASATERRILPGYHLPGEEEAENARRSNL